MVKDLKSCRLSGIKANHHYRIKKKQANCFTDRKEERNNYAEIMSLNYFIKITVIA